MTSFRQIEVNRPNAITSTGPNTDDCKRRSRRKAIQHGLCAEIVIENVEHIEDYRAFEAAVIADYDAQTAVERELVPRLASLLWRLRHATAIETDLLRIQAEILRDQRDQTQSQGQPGCPRPMLFRVIETAIPLRDESADGWNDGDPEGRTDAMRAIVPVQSPKKASRDLVAMRFAMWRIRRATTMETGHFEIQAYLRLNPATASARFERTRNHLIPVAYGRSRSDPHHPALCAATRT